MESVMALTRAPCTPSLSTIRLSSSTVTNLSSPKTKTTNHRYLAAFQSQSHLFSPSLIHAVKNKAPRIFLPHLMPSLEVEESYIMIKPDGVQRGLIGEIISRFEKKGFKLKGLKLFQCPKELAEGCEREVSEAEKDSSDERVFFAYNGLLFTQSDLKMYNVGSLCSKVIMPFKLVR